MAEAKSLAITCIVAIPILVLFMLVCFWILKQPGLTFERKYMKALCVLIPLVIVLVTEEDISTLNEEIDRGSIERIMVDEKTGVEYILIQSDGGITPRIDKNGKPIINQQWLKKHEEKELQKKVNRELQKYTVHN